MGDCENDRLHFSKSSSHPKVTTQKLKLPHRESKQSYRNLSSTSPALYQLSCSATPVYTSCLTTQR